MAVSDCELRVVGRWRIGDWRGSLAGLEGAHCHKRTDEEREKGRVAHGDDEKIRQSICVFQRFFSVKRWLLVFDPGLLAGDEASNLYEIRLAPAAQLPLFTPTWKVHRAAIVPKLYINHVAECH